MDTRIATNPRLEAFSKADHNKLCADCGAKGTRWASWNIGVFLCMRCAGFHRSLGTHISKVKSLTLDKWTEEQVSNVLHLGNQLVNSRLNPNPERHPFPQNQSDIERYIRDKYERKLFAESSRAEGSTKQEEGEFEDLVRHFKDMGYSNSEFVRRVLKVTKGDQNETLNILIASNPRSGLGSGAKDAIVEERHKGSDVFRSEDKPKDQKAADFMSSGGSMKSTDSELFDSPW